MSKKLTTEEFIEKAREIHGDKYDYSSSEYVTAKTKVCIICPEHGEFWQTPSNHLKGCGCPKCGGCYHYTTKDFIEQAQEVHGNKYDYSKVEYIDRRTKICIICTKHGEFWQTPRGHLSGCGCPKCVGKFKTTKDFIEQAREVHGDKYDYSKVEYVGAKTKVCIICPEHGEFWQTPTQHLRGNGCLQCAIEKNAEKQRMTREEFIEKAQEVHGDKYDYSKVEYIDTKTKVCIICSIHGEFWQTPRGHLNGKGCPKCCGKYKTTKEFIEQARKVHGDKYDYSKVKYIKAKTKVCITCPVHGEFWQTPNQHLRKNGCPRCHEPRLEKDVNNFLNENNIVFERQKHFVDLKGQRYDFYIPSLNTIIECQGRQHFEYIEYFHAQRGFEYEEERDLKKYHFAIEHGYNIIYYSNSKKYDTFLGEPLIKDLDTLKSVLTSFNK